MIPDPKMRRPVLGVGRRASAQDADVDRVVEQDKVDRDLHRPDRVVVLRVQAGVVLNRHQAQWPLAVEPDRTQVEAAAVTELVERRERLGARLRHRVDQVAAAARVGEYPCDEVALRYLQAGFVLLLEGPLGVDLGPGWHQAREPLGGLVDQLGDAQRPLELVSERRVDRRDIPPGLRLRGHAPASIVSRPCQ